LLLISRDFMASDYCYEIEMPIALDRQAKGMAKVLPIILRDCDWQDRPFGKLYAIPSDGITDGKPIADFPNPDHAYRQIGDAIKKAVTQTKAPSNSTDAANPFIYGNPVPPEKFYGRRRERLEVKSRIGTGQSINIVGLRRIGKSSLLNYIQARPEEFFTSGQQPLMVRLDLTDKRFHSPDGIVEGLRRGIKEQLGLEPWKTEANGDDWAVQDGLEDLRRQQRSLIIMLDEFEAIASRLAQFQGWDEDWRSKASAGLFTLVVASKRPIGEVYQASHLTSSFGNIFATTILGAFESRDWQKLVKDGFENKPLSEALLQWLEDWTGGLPLHVQMAASILWHHSDQKYNLDTIQRKLKLQAEQHFIELWQSLNPLEKLVLTTSLENQQAENTVLIENLYRHGLLHKHGQVCSLAFKQFIREQL
jgi:hypothetical protein